MGLACDSCETGASSARSGTAPPIAWLTYDPGVKAVGVVIPAYNPKPEHLARAVRSVRNQTLSDWACVVVDDGSVPPASIDSAVSGRNIAVVRQENQGVAAARNRGVATVPGEYLAFLDQDDEWFPEKLAHQVSFMGKHDLVMCDTDFNIIEDGGIIATGYEYHGGDFCRLLSTARMGQSTLIVRRDAFESVGGFDEQFWVTTDWEFQVRVASAGLMFDRLPEVQCAIHLHGQNASSDYRAMYQEQIVILRRYANDNRPTVREAARRGRKRVRELYAYQAIDAFRSTREPGHLVWAAQRAPEVVTRAVMAKLVRKNPSALDR